MTIKSKAMQMRGAIDAIDLALHGDVDWTALMALWEAADDEVKIVVGMTLQELRQICAARDECNRIINSPEFNPDHFR